MSGLLAVLMAFTALIGMGTTAFAASETAESYMVSYPRDGDAVQVYDQSTWGHSAKTYMNGWSTQSSNVTTIHCMDSYDGKAEAWPAAAFLSGLITSTVPTAVFRTP